MPDKTITSPAPPLAHDIHSTPPPPPLPLVAIALRPAASPLHVAGKLSTSVFALSDSIYALARRLKNPTLSYSFTFPHYK
jgi:hypothetical protein